MHDLPAVVIAVVAAEVVATAPVAPADKSTAARPSTVLQVTVEVISLKAEQAVNFLPLPAKAMTTLLSMIRNCFLEPLFAFSTNFMPSSQPERPVMSDRLVEGGRSC